MTSFKVKQVEDEGHKVNILLFVLSFSLHVYVCLQQLWTTPITPRNQHP